MSNIDDLSSVDEMSNIGISDDVQQIAHVCIFMYIFENGISLHNNLSSLVALD